MSVRFIHNIIGSEKVDIYLDNKAIALNLERYQQTGYLSFSPGNYKLTIKVSENHTIIATKHIELCKSSLYTFLLLGNTNDLKTISLNQYTDNNKCPNPGEFNIRFIHGIYLADAVDVYLNNNKIFTNIKYSQTSTYKSINLDTINKMSLYYELSVVLTGTKIPIFPPQKQYYVNGAIYTIVAASLTDPFLILLHDNQNNCETLQENFDTQAYMGKWFQIADIPQVYESGCPRASAEYTLLNDRVSVFNTCYNEKWEVSRTITGYAKALNPCIPSALKVVFPETEIFVPQYPGPNYLIHKTNYKSYAIVGSPTRTSFYILSRTPKITQSKYNKFLKYAKTLGYNPELIKPNYHTIIPNPTHCN